MRCIHPCRVLTSASSGWAGLEFDVTLAQKADESSVIGIATPQKRTLSAVHPSSVLTTRLDFSFRSCAEPFVCDFPSKRPQPAWGTSKGLLLHLRSRTFGFVSIHDIAFCRSKRCGTCGLQPRLAPVTFGKTGGPKTPGGDGVAVIEVTSRPAVSRVHQVSSRLQVSLLINPSFRTEPVSLKVTFQRSLHHPATVDQALISHFSRLRVSACDVGPKRRR